MENNGNGLGMKNRAGREKFVFLSLLCFTLLCFFRFFSDSGNAKRLMEMQNLHALSELCLLFLYIFAIFLFRKRVCVSKKRFLLCFSLPLLLSAYIHRFFLPLAVSFLYFFLLALLFGFLLSGKISCVPKRIGEILSGLPCQVELFFILPFLYIQISRSNIALDYDSLRYRLRSAFILFSPSDSVSTGVFALLKGFFNSHGLLNAVYSYPKGLEALTAPLSFLPGYGFLLAFQIWIYLALGFTLFLLARKSNFKSTVGVFLLFFFFPSIGNMAVTVKTDNITLLLQVLSLYFYAKGERKNSLSMLILSYSFKPTAVVFSTLILIGLFLDSLFRRNSKDFFYEEKPVERGRVVKHFTLLGSRKEGSTALLLFALLFICLITLRTYLITGLPFSTTFTGIFKAIGFSVKWTFNLDAHVDYSGEKDGVEIFLSFLRRVFSFLFYPVGEDMAHVSIAWNGVLFPGVLFFAFKNAICGTFSKRKKYAVQGDGGSEIEEKNLSYLRLVFLLISVFSLLSFLMLWQIDGNYYSLWECLALLLALSSSIGSSPIGSEKSCSFSESRWIKGGP